MKELIEIIVKGFLGYLPVLIAVTTKPKPSILKLITNEPDKLNKALTFCFISIAIGFVLQAPLLKTSQDFVTIAGSLGAIKLFAALIFAGVIKQCFVLVGGKADYETTLCAGLYITSPIYLFVVVTYLIEIGILSSYNPEYVLSWRSGELTPEQTQAFFSSSPLLAYSLSLLQLSQFLISIVWFIVCWGTYRVIHQVSRTRSVLVYFFAILMWYVYWVTTILIVKALNNGVLLPIV